MNEYASVAVRNQNGFLTVFHTQKKEHPWRFPGGKIEVGELAISAAARELKEELGIEALSLSYAGCYKTFVDGKEWTGHFFLCENFKGEPSVQEPDKMGEMRYLHSWELQRLGSTPENAVACALDLENGA